MTIKIPLDKSHIGGRFHQRFAFDAVSYLSIFLFLTCAVPSYLTIPVLGSLGRPTTLWGLVGLLWWAVVRVGRHTPLTSGSKPVRLALSAFVGCVLLSYSLANFQGLPNSESSVADSGLLRMAAWTGVALVANDGIDSRERFHTLLRRIALAGALMATLGLAQFWTGNSLIGWLSFPGFFSEETISGVQNRSGFVRPAGTATHPLEYGVVICTALPIAISLALTERYRSPIVRWYPVTAMALAAVLSVSRSTLIGLAVTVLVLAPSWSKRVRGWAVLVLVGGSVAVFIAVPGMAGTIRGLFMDVGTDSSTISRTNSYDLAFEIANHNPIFGRGFQTLLPAYVILDNQFLGVLIELGYVGFAATVATLFVAMFTSARSGSRWQHRDDFQVGFAVTASLASVTIMFAFFDGLGFPMSAGLLFLMFGVAGAAHSNARVNPDIGLNSCSPYPVGIQSANDRI